MELESGDGDFSWSSELELESGKVRGQESGVSTKESGVSTKGLVWRG